MIAVCNNEDMEINVKLFFSLLATAIVIVAYYPYIKDVFLRKTKPHSYTWLIWAITQGTATVALIQGGGGFSSLGLIAGTLLVILVFILSLKYGTKNVTRSDAIVLGSALLAVLAWWALDNALLAVLMVTTIDALGYIPTIRKTFAEPWSETLLFWIAMEASVILILFANEEYNLLTSTFLTMLAVANAIVIFVIVWRRKSIAKPTTLNAVA